MPRKNSIPDKATTTNMIAEWMHNNCPAWSIDTLLSHPDHAIIMGLDVAERRGSITAKAAQILRRRLRELSGAHEITQVHEICRAALADRKQGDLKRDVA